MKPNRRLVSDACSQPAVACSRLQSGSAIQWQSRPATTREAPTNSMGQLSCARVGDGPTDSTNIIPKRERL